MHCHVEQYCLFRVDLLSCCNPRSISECRSCVTSLRLQVNAGQYLEHIISREIERENTECLFGKATVISIGTNVCQDLLRTFAGFSSDGDAS